MAEQTRTEAACKIASKLLLSLSTEKWIVILLPLLFTVRGALFHTPPLYSLILLYPPKFRKSKTFADIIQLVNCYPVQHNWVDFTMPIYSICVSPMLTNCFLIINWLIALLAGKTVGKKAYFVATHARWTYSYRGSDDFHCGSALSVCFLSKSRALVTAN